MNIEVTYFGRLAEITHKHSERIEGDFETAQDFIQTLWELYPEMKHITLNIAQNNKIVQKEQSLVNMNIDVFPPFSGG
jgi:molybdopterin converting factor small subunit